MKMRRYLEKINNNWIYLLLLAIILFLYYPALNNFYTHDDFFHFKISNAISLKEFLLFFDPTRAPEGWGFYRPLTTQVLYFVVRNLFHFNSVAAHLLALGMFLIVCALVYKLLLLFTENKQKSLIGLFLYATSASHFTHLYSIANQELGHAIFYLGSVLAFIKFLKERKSTFYFLSLLGFLGSLMSKELAVTLPFVLILVYGFRSLTGKVSLKTKEFIRIIVPFFVILGIYGYLHVFYYGLIQGESYVWSISPKTALNSLFWYSLWSVNIPKLLPDFIGPGLSINPKLFLYWGSTIKPILILFSVLSLLTLSMIVTTLKKNKKDDWLLYAFSAVWFSLILSPVIFLQWHKFWEYLTLPLVGIVLFLSHLIVNSQQFLKKKKLLLFSKLLPILFLTIFIIQSKLTLNLAWQTEWHATGARIARRVHNYLIENTSILKNYKTIVFYDTKEDEDLPWSPSETLKVVLSDQNYFKVFWNNRYIVRYSGPGQVTSEGEVLNIGARNFLGY